jgi:UDP-N-acetylbacillosamine N-acetyltransferase
MNPTRGLLVFGFGGHARSVADVALAAGVSDLCFVDTNAQEGESLLGFPVIKQWDGELPEGWQAFSAAGDNLLRQQHCEHFKALGWPLATLIAPSATIGVGSAIEAGCLVAQQAHIGPMAKLGAGCIVNTCAVVEHECAIGEFTHVSVNATIAGRSKIGRFTMVGAGATIIDGIELADHVTIGAGAVVIRSLFQPGVYVGIPARKTDS